MSSVPASYWEDVTPRAAKSSHSLPKQTDILIIGGGFCGSWLGHFLAKEFVARGKKAPSITIVERDAFARGASTRNAGFLSSGNISEYMDDVKIMGMDAALDTYRARVSGVEIVKREFGHAMRIRDIGSTDFSTVGPSAMVFMAQFNQAVGEHVFEMGRQKLGGKDVYFIRNSIGAPINPVRLLNHLHQSNLDQGVRLVFNQKADNIGRGVAEFTGLDGRKSEVKYGYAISCINAFAQALNVASIVDPARGQVIVTSPVDRKFIPQTLGFMNGGYDYFRPVGRGDRLLIGGGRHMFRERENIASFDTTQEIGDYLKTKAAEIIGHGDFKVDYHWAGVMGMPAGKHSSAVRMLEPVMMDEKTRELAGFSGWGVTLTPYVTEKIAQEFALNF